ncbi:MAG TPA: flagellar biosynthetic protein FliQ [Clostridia bacterium]|nr:flagellar biosynthetic protein FliQ [Clostridia bacterium]
MDMTVALVRRTIEMTVLLAAPVLALAMVVSVLINIVQVLTSIQEATVATVPRLAITAVAAFLLMPWMVRNLATFTVQLFSDFRPFLR